MRTVHTTSVLSAAAAAALFASLALAEAPQAGKPAQAPETSKVAGGLTPGAGPPLFSYRPLLRGAPATRVGGSTRSVGARPLTVQVLAPLETGYTTRERPTVYWYLSDTVHDPLELAITSTASLEESASPVLEITLQPPLEKGVHALRLEEHAITLKSGVEYQWFVAVVTNAAQRSSDVVAGGSIKRLADGEVHARLDQAPEAARAAIYAESGIWYDAIEELSRRIEAAPANAALHVQRAALLEQVGLREAAEFERAAGR